MATMYEIAKRVVPKAVERAEDFGLDARVKVGGEQMLPDSGGQIYFRQDRVYVEADMKDFETMKAISALCEEFGLHVDSHQKQLLADENYALLAIEWEEYEDELD